MVYMFISTRNIYESHKELDMTEQAHMSLYIIYILYYIY